jgi:hypothetical protein
MRRVASVTTSIYHDLEEDDVVGLSTRLFAPMPTVTC